MLYFKSRLSALFLMLVALGMTAAGAQATLMTRDLSAAGDGLITFDDVTNLEWVDLTETVGLSPNDALSGNSGFHFATLAQVEALFTGVGGTLNESTFLGSNFTPAKMILDFLGCTALCGSGQSNLAQGFAISTIDPTKFNAPFAQLAFPRAGPEGLFSSGGSGLFTSTSTNTEIGSFLIRTASNPTTSDIPEPASLFLFGFGLIGLAGVRRRQRQ